MTPGRCKGKAHQPEHLGITGRRVLVSRKWSNKTLADHRAERGEFVQQLLPAIAERQRWKAAKKCGRHLRYDPAAVRA
jgi:Replication initiator protein, pSAM2